ncbi:hypothetical protein PsorP6_010527 [Peronosclerospora sorghi]|uniref:Uncharacterized protein n=1 Tax=Peronosclerospora sorghi TaxID=230839 RepID=A0ACC0VXB4_9STRA|nr:hypothetical protein PsorP6_010527 [Peronosclerospora sorghi]
MSNRKNSRSWDFAMSRTHDFSLPESEKSHSRSATSSDDFSGLSLRNASVSRQQLVHSGEEIRDDIVATMTKLETAVRTNGKGGRWKHSHGKHGVQLAEMKAHYACDEFEDDTDLLHAVTAKTELRCHLNEALSVLLHQKSNGYDSTMRALCGKQFKKGEVIFFQGAEAHEAGADHDETPKQAALSVTSATMRPSASLKMRLQSRRNRTQQLVFSAYTYQDADKKHAVHLMKTVPRNLHKQPLLRNTPNSLLGGEIDHIGIGFDLRYVPHPGGSSRQCTQIFAHAYASDIPAQSFSNAISKEPEEEKQGAQAVDIRRRRVTLMNPETRNIMRTLTTMLSQFERVIRRRRFGFQAFIDLSQAQADLLLEKNCMICNKMFYFFRQYLFCQLCGHMVCGDCSGLYDVEARIGVIRQDRCCKQCVVRVDACKFDDEDLLPALGPIIVDTPSEEWTTPPTATLSPATRPAKQGFSPEVNDSDLTKQLCSEDAATRSRALEILETLVDCSPQFIPSVSSSARANCVDRGETKSHEKSKRPRKKQTQVEHVFAGIENHLNETLSKAQRKVSVNACDVSDRTRDYKLRFDASKVTHKDIPLAPIPEATKDARRVELIKSSGALKDDYDRSALNLIAQVAAKRLGCPIGVVTMIDDEHFYAVGDYNLPPEARNLPRNEVPCMHSVYAEKPLVIKNPQRDMRFSKMPCVDNLGVKFYAGFPLRAQSGEVIGNLCAIDAVAHNNISTKDYSTMETLAKLASDLLRTPQLA